jgi:hypothetical protein
MPRPALRFVPRLALCALLLAACQPSSDGAVAAIENYLAARVEKDVDAMTRLSCPAWEGQARIEALTFAAMEARLDGVSCEAGGTDGDFQLVSCAGQIVTTYQGETREWSVAEHPYRALLDGGEWLMCGYGE